MEPPGTAPGSDPLIASAFMSIASEEAPKIYALERRFASGLHGWERRFVKKSQVLA